MILDLPFNIQIIFVLIRLIISVDHDINLVSTHSNYHSKIKDKLELYYLDKENVVVGLLKN